MVTKQIKQAVAGTLIFALTLGAPGLPCQQALAQMSAARAGGAAAVPGGVGAAGAASIAISADRALAPIGLVPGMASPVSLFAPAPSLILSQAPNGVTPAGPAAVAAQISGAVVLPRSAIPSRAARSDAPTTWNVLQRIGGFASKVRVNDAASAEAGRGIGAAFDGSASATDDLFAAPVAAKPSSRGLLKAGTLSAAAAAVAMPLPAVAAPAAQAVSAASSLPMDTGSMVVLGLAAVGLGIFLYNVNQAVTGWRDMRRIERRHKAYIHAVSVLNRHSERLKRETGAVHVSVLETSLNQWELVVYHNDRAMLAAQKAMPAIEGLPVRAERLTPAAVVRLLMVRPEPAPSRRRGSPLVRALLIGAAATAALMLLTAAATAAPLTAAVTPVLAMTGGGATFGLGAFAFFLLFSLLFECTIPEALLVGVVAGLVNPFLALLIFLVIVLSPDRR